MFMRAVFFIKNKIKIYFSNDLLKPGLEQSLDYDLKTFLSYILQSLIGTGSYSENGFVVLRVLQPIVG